MTPYDRDVERFLKSLPAPVMVASQDRVADLTVDRVSGHVSFKLPVESEINPRDYVRVEEEGQHPRLAQVAAVHINTRRMMVEAYMPFQKNGEEV